MSNEINAVEAVTIVPVQFGAKGNKITEGNVGDLTVEPTLNIRHRAGSTVHGVTIKADTYDVESLKIRICDDGGIQKPIVVSVRQDGTKVVLCGNRRTLAGQELLSDTGLPKELRTKLSKHTPMILLHGLTSEQERQTIMDQDNKEFLRSEIVRYIFSLRESMWSYEQIAMQCWEAMGKLSGNAKKLAEVRQTTDSGLKRTKIKTWLNGSLNGYYIKAYDLGEFVRKCTLLSEMAIDGLQNGEADEKPYFITTKDSQNRFIKLMQARKADGTKFNGLVPQEGSEFKKVLDQFHAEDYLTAKKEKSPSKVMMKRDEVEQMGSACQSQAVKQVIQRILGQEAPDINVRDKQAQVNEAKCQLLEPFLGKLKNDVEAIVRMCLVNGDPVDFQNFLLANVKDGETV